MSLRELVIIGGGPAGCSAAVYAARSRIDTVLVTKDFGGQLLLTDSVENYLGFTHETGPGLSEKYEKHVKDYDVEVHREEVKNVEQKGDNFLVHAGDRTIKTKTVIVATGTEAKYLNVPGEEEFNNRGVAYCAVCDGPLYRDEKVAVIGGGYSGTEAALFLSDICDTVYLLNYGTEFSGEPITIEQIPEQDNIKIIHNADTKEFYGEQMLAGLRYEDRETGETHELEVAGAFIEIGRTPNNDFIDFVEKNEEGRIIKDNNMRTNVPGIFAAGDCSNISEEQAVLAAGEGCAAALQVGRYLKERE